MRRVTFALAAVLAAVLLQTALLDRLPFPGGAAPDLVLVLVVTLALASGPTEGMLIGFGAGLALDMTPPASHLLGLSALVFCLVGYGCGLLRGPLERSAWLPLAAVVLGVTAGEALYALVGMTFGDPDITWQSVRLMLPVAVVYDILLCPFVMYAVARFGGYGGWAAAGTRASEPLAGRELAGAGGVGLAGGVAAAGAAGVAVRDTRSGREPRLRAAARQGGWIGGHQGGPGQQTGPRVSRRPLNLRARNGVAGSAAGRGPGPGARPGPARPVHLRLGAPRRGDGVLGGSLRSLVGGGLAGLTGLAGSPGRESRMRGAAFRGSAGPAGGSLSVPSRPGPSSRLPARAFRGSGPARPAGDGSWRGALRTGGLLPGFRPRARAFRGGPSALDAAGRGGPRRSAPLRLRRRRRDGVLGGGVLGSRASGNGNGMPGAALRSGRGQGAVPRFRGAGRGLRRGSLPGGTLPGRGGLPGRRRGFSGGRRGGLGRRRSAWWRLGTKRTGGLP